MEKRVLTPGSDSMAENWIENRDESNQKANAKRTREGIQPVILRHFQILQKGSGSGCDMDITRIDPDWPIL